MNDFHVFVLSCPCGVLGVFRSRRLPNVARAEYKSYGYTGLEIS